MAAFKEAVRFISKLFMGIAAGIFLFAPFTGFGLATMALSILVILVCLASYLWSEPDIPPADDESS